MTMATVGAISYRSFDATVASAWLLEAAVDKPRSKGRSVVVQPLIDAALRVA